MKFEHLYNFLIFNFNFYLPFIYSIFKNVKNLVFLNYFFNWKVSNYGDSYWFLYSNKKALHELRHLKK